MRGGELLILIRTFARFPNLANVSVNFPGLTLHDSKLVLYLLWTPQLLTLFLFFVRIRIASHSNHPIPLNTFGVLELAH